MSSNFAFLAGHFPALEKQGSLAESYLYSDPNLCLVKLGILSEMIVNDMLKMDNIEPPKSKNTQFNRKKLLEKEGMLPSDISDMLHTLRKKRNKAHHEGYDCLEDAKTLLEKAHSLCIWFMQTYGDYRFEAKNFVLPLNESANKIRTLSECEKTEAPPSKPKKNTESSKKANKSKQNTMTIIWDGNGQENHIKKSSEFTRGAHADTYFRDNKDKYNILKVRWTITDKETYLIRNRYNLTQEQIIEINPKVYDAASIERFYSRILDYVDGLSDEDLIWEAADGDSVAL